MVVKTNIQSLGGTPTTTRTHERTPDLTGQITSYITWGSNLLTVNYAKSCLFLIVNYKVRRIKVLFYLP